MAISDTYRLSTDTALKAKSTFDGHYIYQDRQLYGDDDNTLVHYVEGNGYNSKNVIESSGPLRVSTSSAAGSQSASISQTVMGTGNIFAELQGTQGSDFVDQKTNMIDGSLSLSQSLAAGSLLSASQGTEMSGISCYLESSSLSSSNAMLINGFFYKVEDIKADLTAASQGKAWTMGEISAYGDNCLDEDTLGSLGSKSMGLSFDSSYVKDGEDAKTAPIFKGAVQTNAVNMDRDVFDSTTKTGQAQSSTELESQTYGGQVGNFWGWLPLGNIYDGTTACRWNQANPTIQLYLLTDANYYAEGLNTNSVCTAIQTAANIWDAATYQKLFASTVIASSSVSRDVQDWKSVHSWEYIGPNSNGVFSPGHSHTWYTTSSQKDGFFQIIESDVDYNTYYSWNTNGNSDGINYDVETIAVHELGHTLGLADLYNKKNAPLYKAQDQQIMNYQYNHPLWLGNGDRQAIWNMYGR
ncbi:MAG: matrixin family metalloprotease [Methanothrix sp.]|nr:matrixin family metalloprotease [Methanothrix sp.]